MNRSRDVVLYIAGMIFQQCVTFGASIVVARWLGPEDYGILSLVRNTFVIVLILTPLGLDLSLLRHVNEHEDEPARINGQIRLLRTVVAIAACLLVGLVYVLAGPMLEANVYHYQRFGFYLTLMFLGLPVAADAAILGAVFRARHRPAAQVLVQLYCQPAVRLVFIVVLLQLGFRLSGVLIANAVGYLVASATMSAILRAWNRRQGWTSPRLTGADTAAVRSLLKDSSWLALSLLVYGMLRNVDVMILGAFRPSKIVGEYAAISSVAQAIQFFPQSVSQTLGAVVARHYAQKDLASLKATLTAYLRQSTLLAAPVFAGVAAFGPWLDLVFGGRFTFAPGVTAALAAGYYISAVLAPMGYSLSMTGRHRLEFTLLLAGTGLIVATCLLVTPVYGAQGTAITVAAGYLAINGARAVLVQRLYGFVAGDWRDLLPPLVALCLALLVRTVGERFLGRSLTSFATLVSAYAAACVFVYWFWLFRPTEKSYLRARLRTLAGAY